MSTQRAEPARFQRASDQSLLIYFGDQITLDAHDSVRRLLCLLELQPIAGVRNVHPAYCSLLLKFDPMRLLHDDLERTLKQYLDRLQSIDLPKPHDVKIPVCYGGEYGPDLLDVSALQKITPEQVIELHSSTTYVVYFLGFVPGFAYLGELPVSLVTPRLGTPRRSVPAGSVGIAGNQTGVYPFATPGGWRLIGRTPVSIFEPTRNELSLLTIGDRVRFAPISVSQFTAMQST